jgi:hypothetical protein
MQLFPTTQSPIANQLYHNFIALLVRLYPQRLGDILHQHFAFSSAMNLSEKLQKVARLKAGLDSFRPLSPTLVAEVKKLYDVRVYLSLQCAGGKYFDTARNRISSKTGITVGGKTWRERLEVIGHRDAID